MFFSGHANNRSETEQQRKLNKTEIVSRHTCHMSHISHMSHMSHMSHVTHVTRHTCHISHMSHVTPPQPYLHFFNFLCGVILFSPKTAIVGALKIFKGVIGK